MLTYFIFLIINKYTFLPQRGKNEKERDEAPTVLLAPWFRIAHMALTTYHFPGLSLEVSGIRRKLRNTVPDHLRAWMHTAKRKERTDRGSQLEMSATAFCLIPFPKMSMLGWKGTVSILRSITYTFETIVSLVYSLNIQFFLMCEMKIFSPMMLIFQSHCDV